MKNIKLFFLSIIFLLSINGFSADKLLIGLHGFMRSTGNFSAFHEEFTKLGWLVYRWDYPSRSKKIQDLARDFVNVMKEVEKKFPNHEVFFVTHSLGGLVLRASMNHVDFPQKYKHTKAVLIAPPNQGSSFGRFLGQYKPFRLFVGKKSGKELTTAENFTYLGQFPSTMKILVLAGTCGYNPLLKEKNDGKVTVNETRLETPHEHKEIFAGHSWICHTTKAIELSKNFFLKP